MSDTLRVSNLHFGNAASNYNQPQMGFTSVGIGSTANYGFLQFFGTSNTLCWTANGTVGIGTTAPRNALDVNGSLSIGNRVLGTPDSSPNGIFWLGLNGTGTEAERLAIGIAGNQTSGIVNTIELNKNTNVLGNFIKKGTTNDYDIRISGGTATNSGYVDFFADGVSRGYIGNASLIDLDIVAQNGTKLNFYTAGTRRLLIDTNGNVGINVANPVEKLHIFQNSTNVIRLQTSSVDNAYIVAAHDFLFIGVNQSSTGTRENTGRGSSQIVLQSPTAGGLITFNTNPSINTGLLERMRITSNGNIGIGTAAPTSSLHLNGLLGSGLWSNTCLMITNSISGAAGTASGTSVQLHNAFNSNYFNMMSYGYTGGAAIYITSDSLIGVTFARGQNAWSTYSDSRMKINKIPLSSELSNILKLNPVSYLYDTDPSENVAIVTRVGFLADEVAEIYPNLVTKDSGMPYTNQEGETFIPMTMCMTNLIPYHTKAIQELSYKNDVLEAKNAELTQKLDALLAWAQAQGFSS